MNLINIISIFLILSPIYGVLTDIKFGKIKNYFIFPLLLISMILFFFIEGFFTKDNIIGLFIIFLFGFLFYKNNKWGAGDGKYLILLGINSIIIAFLKGFGYNIISILFFNIFIIIFIYNLFYIILNLKKIKKIKFSKLIKFNFLIDLGNIFLIFLSSNIIGNFVGNKYNYIIIFLFILLIIPFVKEIKNKYFYLLIISLGFLYILFFQNIFGFFIIGIIFYIFSFLNSFFEQIFEIIDTKNIKIFNIKSGDILTQKSLQIINKNLKMNFEETPLQGNEIFEIIGYYKNNGNNIDVMVYKDIKLGIIMYFGYFLTIFIIFFYIN